MAVNGRYVREGEGRESCLRAAGSLALCRHRRAGVGLVAVGSARCSVR